MNLEYNDILATGLLTTLGGPAVLCICVAKIFGVPKAGVSWFLLAPLIQAEIVVWSYMASYGLKISHSFEETLLFVSVGSTIVSVGVCALIHFLEPSKKIKREINHGPQSDVLRRVFLLGIFYLLAIGMVYSTYSEHSDFDCLSDLRCRSFSGSWGAAGYAGSLLFPTLIMGGVLIIIYHEFFLSVLRRKKD